MWFPFLVPLLLFPYTARDPLLQNGPYPLSLQEAHFDAAPVFVPTLGPQLLRLDAHQQEQPTLVYGGPSTI